MGNCTRSSEWEGAQAAPGPINGREPAGARAPSTPVRAEHSARELLGGGRQAVIHHEGRRYLLSLTRANKLILTRDEEAGG